MQKLNTVEKIGCLFAGAIVVMGFLLISLSLHMMVLLFSPEYFGNIVVHMILFIIPLTVASLLYAYTGVIRSEPSSIDIFNHEED